MDSSLVNEGVRQRVRIEVVFPIATRELAATDAQLVHLRGELACIVQWVYESANGAQSSRLQQLTLLLLLPAKLHRWTVFWGDAFTAAAVEIQRYLRKSLAIKATDAARVERSEGGLARFQAVVRGCSVRQALGRAREELRGRMALVIQCCIRQKLARNMVRYKALEVSLRVWACLFEWGAVQVQRVVRGHLARRLGVGKALELSLTERVSSLADKFITKGDIWAFLEQVNADYCRYEATIQEMQAREDDMAATFIEKVVLARDEQVEEGWGNFSQQVVRHRLGVSARSEGHRANPHSMIQVPKETEGTREEALQASIIQEQGGRASSLGSTYLRAAIPAHARIIGATGNSTTGLGELSMHLHSPLFGLRTISGSAHGCDVGEHSPEGMSPTQCCKGGSRRRDGAGGGSGRARVSGACNRSRSCSRSRSGSPKRHGGSATGRSTAIGTAGSIHSFGEEGMETPQVLCHSFCICSYASPSSHKSNAQQAGWEAQWDSERVKRDLTGTASSRFPGSSSLRDLPSGSEDTVDRLLAAAFLRGHVPSSMPAGTTPAASWEQYLLLPPSLAKVRHEQEAVEAAKPFQRRMYRDGYKLVSHLLPPSKMVSCKV
ncbi:unnamed protein product [Chrysoparadoxa australica]